jgi:nitroreductase
MDVLEAISRRVSVRSYQPEPADMSLLEEIGRSGEQAEALTNADMQFHLLSNEQIGKEIKGIIGDYGKIIRAPHYFVLVAQECEGYVVDAGFRFEQLILEATRNNLGTCWVGGMFKESSIRSTLGLDGTSRVIALTPIGRAAAPGMGGRAIKGLVRSSKRKPVSDIFCWQRRGGALPESILSNERLVQVLEATRWAPSWANKQPWRFILGSKEVLVYKQMRQNKEGKDYHLLDCGIAMAHLHLAARALGIGGQWELGRFDVPGAPHAEPVGRYPLREAIG